MQKASTYYVDYTTGYFPPHDQDASPGLVYVPAYQLLGSNLELDEGWSGLTYRYGIEVAIQVSS